MKYLFALAVILCLAGCATPSTTQATSQKLTVTNYAVMPDGVIYSWDSSQ